MGLQPPRLPTDSERGLRSSEPQKLPEQSWRSGGDQPVGPDKGVDAQQWRVGEFACPRRCPCLLQWAQETELTYGDSRDKEPPGEEEPRLVRVRSAGSRSAGPAAARAQGWWRRGSRRAAGASSRTGVGMLSHGSVTVSHLSSALRGPKQKRKRMHLAGWPVPELRSPPRLGPCIASAAGPCRPGGALPSLLPWPGGGSAPSRPTPS